MQPPENDPDTPSPEKYAAMSRQYMERAESYLQTGDRIQASEKGWGSVAGALKSVAEERGWHHKSHRLLDDVAEQLSLEWDHPEVRFLFDTGERLRLNSYDDFLDSDAIAARLANIKALLQTLATLRAQPPRPVAVRTREQRLRWRRLTGQLPPLAPGQPD